MLYLKRLKTILPAAILLVGIFSSLGYIILSSYRQPQPFPSTPLTAKINVRSAFIRDEPRYLRVVMPSDLDSRHENSPFGPGLELELLAEFAKDYGYGTELLFSESTAGAIEMLKSGNAELAIGFGGFSPEAQDETIAMSEAYATFNPVVIKQTGLNDGPLQAPTLSIGGNAKLPGKDLRKLDETGAHMVEPLQYPILLSTNENIKTLGKLSTKFTYRWYWNSDLNRLSRNISDFWQKEEFQPKLDEMYERYYGFIPEKPKHADVRQLSEIANGSITNYASAISRASKETRLDPLLLAAVIFQESRFDPHSRSATGVRGLMQLTTSTAAMLNVDRLNPEESILGGARYLRQILDSLDSLDLPKWDKLCLTLAAYNQGPGNLRKALKQAEQNGHAPNWTQMRQVYGGLGKTGAASGGFKGKQAIDFVESVRYYYFILSRLSSPSFEFEHLSALLDIAGDSIAFAE